MDVPQMYWEKMSVQAPIMHDVLNTYTFGTEDTLHHIGQVIQNSTYLTISNRC